MSVVQVEGATVDLDVVCSVTLASATAGNVLWAIMTTNRASGNIGIPSGFTEVDREANGGGCNYVTAYKVAAGGETTISFDALSGSSRMALTVYELDNIDTAALPPVSSTSVASAVTSYTTPSATGPGVIIAGVSHDNTTTTPVAWVGWTNGFTAGVDQSTLAGSNNIAQSSGYLITASSGPFTSTQEWGVGNTVDVAGGYVVFTESGGGGPVEYTQTPTDNVDVTDSYEILFNGSPLTRNVPQFVGVTSSSTADTTSFDVTAPTGVVAGDKQYLFAICNTEEDVITGISAGWNLVEEVINPKTGGGDKFVTTIYESTTDTGTVTVTHTNTVTAHFHAARIAYTDVDSVANQDFMVSVSGASQAATHPIPGFSTTNANSLIFTALLAEEQPTDDDNVFTAPVGFTERFQEHSLVEVMFIVLNDREAPTLETFSGNYTSSKNSFSNTFSVELIGTLASTPSGTTHTEDATDAEDITDEVDKVVSYSRPSTDTVGLTDEVTIQSSGAPEINVTDSVGITDEIDKEASKVRVDSVNITDIRDIQKPQDPSNDTGITDEFSVVLFRGRESTDPVAVSEIVSMEFGKSRSDHIFVEDEVIMARSISFTPDDTMGITDEIILELPDKLEFNTTVGITDLVTVTHIANTRKASNISLVDDRRVIVQTTLILSDEQTALLTITDLAYQYWSDLSGLTPVEAQSMYDHFKDADPDGKHWIESIK